jgi:hypothetical protein
MNTWGTEHVLKFITIYLISTTFLLITTQSNIDIVPYTYMALPSLRSQGSL